jgi:ABC-type multidrug transport system permease subunit
MQMQFFNILSYIMPFTYLIHAQGAIIFGIGANFDLVNSFLYLLEMLGITLIYVVVFFLIGIYSTKKIKRKYMYGSVNSTIIKQALISCNKKEYISDSKID